MEASSAALPYRSSTRTASSSFTPSAPLASRPYTYSSPGSALNQSEDPVVIEIGTRYLRAGFANESAPRCSIPYTEDLWRRVGDRAVDAGQRRGSMLPQKPGAIVEERVVKKKSTRRSRGELWQFDLRMIDTGLVEDVVERAVREAYNSYLLVDSKSRKVVLPVPPLLPTYLVTAITNTIFKHFQPTTIIYFSAPTLCTVSAGLRSALIVDIGWHETVISPIYELRAISGLVGACGRSKRAGKLLRKKTGQALESLLAEKGIEGTKIREDFLEDLIARVLWCENHTMHKKEREEQKRLLALKSEGKSFSPPSSKPVFSTAGSATMLIPIATTDSLKPLSINIPLSILSTPIETAFFGATSYSQSSYFDEDEPDEDDLSIPHLIYQSLLACPIDVRATCLSRIVIVGGPSNIPGLKKRIIDEFRELVEERGGWSNIKPSKKFDSRRKQPSPVPEPAILPPSPLPPTPRIHTTSSTDDEDGADEKPLPASRPQSPSELDDPMENLELFTNRDRSRKYLELEEKENLKPKYPPGMIRGVNSLGTWAGASILAGARVKGILEVDREKFLSNVSSGGTGFPSNTLF